MKLRKLFLGVAIVALMAACGGKTETTTETAAEAPVVETPAEEATEAPAEEPVAEVKNETKPAAKQADPCEAKVKKFEQFVDKLQAAQKNKANGAAALKEFAALVKEADAEQAAVKECINNVDYKSRVQNAMMRCKTSLK
ncbi:MAG: hypothetical protein UH543_04840 [Bacteroidales bacterium]|jgi:hypothetical protein|nr:hypothetical protein [Bacteroidales bacterium]